MASIIHNVQFQVLKKQFTQHCITSCLSKQGDRLNIQQQSCLKNCASKVNQYKKFAKDLGFQIK